MGRSKPKLLIVEGPSVDGAEVAQALSGLFDVTIAGPGAVDARRRDEWQAVLASEDAAARTPAAGGAAPRDVLDALGEGVCLADHDGVIVWSNQRFSAYDEQTRARIGSVCRRAARRFAAEPEPETAETGESHVRDSGPSGLKFEIASSDGERSYEVLVSRAPGSEGRVAALVWDVTQARGIQQKMEAIDRAGTELVRLDAEQIRRMHAVERLKLLEEKIVRYSHELLNFDHFTIRLLSQESGTLELVVASGLSPEAMEADVYPEREGNGITGYVAATGKSYLCPDVTKDRRYAPGLRHAASSLTVPLRLHDRVIGVFNVESERAGAFSEEDRQFAEMFANHIALALHILDLLVVERSDAGQTVTGRVEGELNEPLEDIVHEADYLREQTGPHPGLREHIERILKDVEAIRSRVRAAASGPQHILGAERALADLAVDPLLLGKLVLVADDEPKIRQVIKEVLTGKGARVVSCENGAEAIRALGVDTETGEIAEPAGGQRQRFDLVISDIKMPDRNGYQVFAAARRVREDLPVILMTGFGYDPHHSIVRASQEGMKCVLFKPFQVERLLEEVHKSLGESCETEANQD